MNKGINILFSIIKRILIVFALAVLLLLGRIWIQYDFSTQALIQHVVQFDRTQIQNIDRSNPRQTISGRVFNEEIKNQLIKEFSVQVLSGTVSGEIQQQFTDLIDQALKK